VQGSPDVEACRERKTVIEADTNPFDTSDEEDFVRIMLDGERRGLVRPELDANGQWSWVILRACHVENGMLVDDERPIGRTACLHPR
jgi:hypothetical protein